METGRMMKMEFREFRKEDIPALEGIIRQTWNYDKFASPKTAQKLARVFLSSCLANQTFSQVAVENGKPVGIILGKILPFINALFHTDGNKFVLSSPFT